MGTVTQWRFDSNHWSFDDNRLHTWDGWHGDTGGGGTYYPTTLTKELREEDELVMRVVRQYMDLAA